MSHNLSNVIIAKITEETAEKLRSKSIDVVKSGIDGFYFVNQSSFPKKQESKLCRSPNGNDYQRFMPTFKEVGVQLFIIIDTDYFSGFGEQTATPFTLSPDDSDPCLYMEGETEDSINDVLKNHFGIVKSKPNATDLFDEIGLCGYKCNEDLFPSKEKAVADKKTSLLDDLRQGFEDAYYNQGGLPFYMVSPRDLIFEKNESGDYQIPHVQGAWWAWQHLLAKNN